MNNNRGSAYVFVLIMSLSLFLLLAIAADTTVYEAMVSNTARKYSNLSLLAYSGVELAVLEINSQPEKVSTRSTLEYSLTLPTNDPECDDVYTITVNVTHNDKTGKLTSTVNNFKRPTDETVTADIEFDSDNGWYIKGTKLPTGETVTADIEFDDDNGWQIKKRRQPH